MPITCLTTKKNYLRLKVFLFHECIMHQACKRGVILVIMKVPLYIWIRHMEKNLLSQFPVCVCSISRVCFAFVFCNFQKIEIYEKIINSKISESFSKHLKGNLTFLSGCVYMHFVYLHLKSSCVWLCCFYSLRSKYSTLSFNKKQTNKHCITFQPTRGTETKDFLVITVIENKEIKLFPNQKSSMILFFMLIYEFSVTFCATSMLLFFQSQARRDQGGLIVMFTVNFCSNVNLSEMWLRIVDKYIVDLFQLCIWNESLYTQRIYEVIKLYLQLKAFHAFVDGCYFMCVIHRYVLPK